MDAISVLPEKWVSIPRGLCLRKSNQVGRAKEMALGRERVTLETEGGDVGLLNMNARDRTTVR